MKYYNARKYLIIFNELEIVNKIDINLINNNVVIIKKAKKKNNVIKKIIKIKAIIFKNIVFSNYSHFKKISRIYNIRNDK